MAKTRQLIAATDPAVARVGKALPPGYAVQVKLGEAAIAAIREFASSTTGTVEQLEATTFKSVREKKLQRSLAETLFGARWLYHLGLVTLATDVQRAAHVRAQIIDYAAICEAVLLDALSHGIVYNHLLGTKWKSKFVDGAWKPDAPWSANRAKINHTIRKRRNFRWMIEVGAEEKMFKPGLKRELDSLRESRNAVHIAELAAVGAAASIDVSKTAYRVMLTCVGSIGDWMTMHPNASPS